ncbi:MAG: NAD-dependent epimerase/dehydratase family protein [Candidatus Alectryocaccobium sp.]|nr:NAD-dependent epimerase/dehydratase family protein [Candidatus Alectryocaccobium sp.]
MMKQQLYVITGARGHLASTIIRYLRDEDCLIRGLILPSEDENDDGQITYYKGDVTKPETLEALFENTENKEVIVIHTAAIVSIGKNITPHIYNVNVGGTKNVIDMCIRHNIKRLVYVSSVHAIPEPVNNTVITEVDSFSKDLVTGAYAKTKAEASQTVLDSVKKGLNAVIVHPSGIIGPYDDGSNHIVQLVQMQISGKLPACVTGGYDFVDVRDAAKGCLLAAKKGKIGSCYILSNKYYSLKELLGYVNNISGGKRKICLPLCVAKLFVPLFEWIAKVNKTRPLFTKYALYAISSNSRFSHDKADRELGYSPRDMQTTIKDTILWIQNAKNEMRCS